MKPLHNMLDAHMLSRLNQASSLPLLPHVVTMLINQHRARIIQSTTIQETQP